MVLGFQTLRTVPTLLLCLLALAATADSRPRGRQRDNAALARQFGRVTIRVRQELPQGPLAGTLPPARQVLPAAADFFQALRELPEDFIVRSGIHYVTFLSDLRLNGAEAAGVARGETIYLRPGSSRQTIYHELFHIFDPSIADKQWTRLNARGFIYTGSDFYAASLSRSKEKKMTQNLTEKRFNADFVSRYAMSSEREDRAETFACMIVEGPAFLQRTARSAVLKSKMEYIIDVTGKRRLLGRDFWAARLSKPL